jgi:NAD(P)-dependent dehydrogenase (short-subunit alcohol dehydrogenase family)
MATNDSTLFAGKIALVTGGSRGIGRATAAALLARGAKVAITARTPASLDEARAALGSGEQLLAVQADVSKEDDVVRLVGDVVRRFAGLDILVNNAAVGRLANVEAMSTDDWRAMIETNLTGVFYCCRAAIPHLQSRGAGWIINISSLASQNPFAGGACYSATKAGLDAYSHALMQEVRQQNIRVAVVAPGSVNTGFINRGSEGEASWKLAAEDVAQVVVDLLAHPPRSLPSRVELRPSRPAK